MRPVFEVEQDPNVDLCRFRPKGGKAWSKWMEISEAHFVITGCAQFQSHSVEFVGQVNAGTVLNFRVETKPVETGMKVSIYLEDAPSATIH